MTESQSWVTAKAQEMFQKTGNWSPDRPYPDDLHDNRHNPQVRPRLLIQAFDSRRDS